MADYAEDYLNALQRGIDCIGGMLDKECNTQRREALTKKLHLLLDEQRQMFADLRARINRPAIKE